MFWAQWRNRNITENQPWEHTADQHCWILPAAFMLWVAYHRFHQLDHLAAAPCDRRRLETPTGDIIWRHSLEMVGSTCGSRKIVEEGGGKRCCKGNYSKKDFKVLNSILSLTLSFTKCEFNAALKCLSVSSGEWWSLSLEQRKETRQTIFHMSLQMCSGSIHVTCLQVMRRRVPSK